MFFVSITTYSQYENHTLQICRLNTMEIHTTYLYNELRKLDFTFEINCYIDVLCWCITNCIWMYIQKNSYAYLVAILLGYKFSKLQTSLKYLQKCKKEFLRIGTVFKRWQSRWWLHTQVILKTRTQL